MVAVQIQRRVRTYPHRHALLAEVIVLRRDAVRHFIMISDIVGACATNRFLDAVAVAIVKVGCLGGTDGDARYVRVWNIG